MLKRLGYTVAIATSGRQAIENYSRKLIDHKDKSTESKYRTALLNMERAREQQGQAEEAYRKAQKAYQEKQMESTLYNLRRLNQHLEMLENYLRGLQGEEL